MAAKDKPWELFDLAKDRAETRNLATMLPLKVNVLEKLSRAKQNDFIKDANSNGSPKKKK